MELFARHGQLSHQLWQIGFDVISIDHFAPARAVTPITKLDLAEGPGQEISLQILDQVKPTYLHLGLPCGTCSRARDRPIAKHLVAQAPPTAPTTSIRRTLLGLTIPQAH